MAPRARVRTLTSPIAVALVAMVIVVAGCIGVASTGTGAGPATRYSGIGVVECSEAATTTVRTSTHLDTVEMTLFAQDCAPPAFPDDGSYCLPSDCFTYTFWWNASECDALVDDVRCVHVLTYGNDDRRILHNMEYLVSPSEFRFEIKDATNAGAEVLLYEMDAVLARGSA